MVPSREPRHHGRHHGQGQRLDPRVVRIDGDGDMIMEDLGADLDLKALARPVPTQGSTHELFLPVKGRLAIEMEQFVNTDVDGEERSERRRRWFEFSWVPGCECQECVQEWRKASQALLTFNPNASQ